MDEDSKLTRSKRSWAVEGRFLTGRHTRPEEQRLPPGQHLVRNWPILDLGPKPDIALDHWRLTIDGMVERPLTLDWAALQALPQIAPISDIHCVTTWSRYDNHWRGVATRTLLVQVAPKAEAQAVMLHGYDGYTTNLLLEDFAAEGALIASEWEGRPIPRDHGGPARLVVPHLYFWKSAKWIKRIEFIGRDKPGFWEDGGYHMRGDPWAEERYT